MKIDDIAEVMRFQDRREAAADGEEPGEKEHVWSEVKVENFDPLTGFVMPEGLGLIELYRAPRKYALRKHDILMYVNGAREKIGLAGLVIDSPRAVPSRATCVIRCFQPVALALYYFLREPAIREELVRSACRDTTGAKAFLTQEGIRNFEIAPLFLHALEAVEDKMRRMIENYKDFRKAQKEELYEIMKHMYTAWPE